MKKIVLDENFFDELYNLELNENSYKRYDVINELLINKKEIKGDNLKLFTNGYVAKLISKRLRSIKSVDDVKFEEVYSNLFCCAPNLALLVFTQSNAWSNLDISLFAASVLTKTIEAPLFTGKFFSCLSTPQKSPTVKSATLALPLKLQL